MIPATAKQVFCQFHFTCWFPPRQHVREKARAVWAELPKEASRVTSTSGHCSYLQECPALCLALGIFSMNRGKAERGNHLVPGKNSRTLWRGGRREIQRVPVLSTVPFRRKGPRCVGWWLSAVPRPPHGREDPARCCGTRGTVARPSRVLPGARCARAVRCRGQ